MVLPSQYRVTQTYKVDGYTIRMIVELQIVSKHKVTYTSNFPVLIISLYTVNNQNMKGHNNTVHRVDTLIIKLPNFLWSALGRLQVHHVK